MTVENKVMEMIRDELAGKKHYSMFDEDRPTRGRTGCNVFAGCVQVMENQMTNDITAHTPASRPGAGYKRAGPVRPHNPAFARR